jgi:hypothetical protein
VFDGEAFGSALVAEVRGYIDRTIAPILAENKALIERIAQLEARELPAAVKGDPGEVDMIEVRRLIMEAVRELPPAEKGAPGVVDMDEVAQLVVDAVAQLPPAEKGEPGIVDMDLVADLVAAEVAKLPPAEKGEPGIVDMDAVARMVADEVAKLPPAEKGEPGAVDMDAVAKLIADEVAKLPPAEKGEPGVGLAGALIDRDGTLTLTLSNGEMVPLGLVVGKDGEPGLGFEEFDTHYDGERHLKLIWSRDGLEYIHHLHLPIPIYRGVWQDGQDYERGDTVTWGGSLWHCDAEKSAKKPDGGTDWRLAAKRGRDGKDAGPKLN